MLVSTNLLIDYRFGFNGKEKDNEVKGIGNSLDFGARIYDSRIGKWLSEDPEVATYPQVSSYNYVLNNPINYVDKDGKKVYIIVYDNTHKNFMYSALTRKNQIEGDKSFDVKSDKVYLVKMTDLGVLKKTVKNIVTEANKNNYGKTVELGFFSHGGVANGPVGDPVSDPTQSQEALSGESSDAGQLTDGAWSRIDFNFDPKQSMATFNTCNGGNFAEKFLGLQPSLQYAAGIDGKACGNYSTSRYDKPYFPSSSDYMYMTSYYSPNPDDLNAISIYSREKNENGFRVEINNNNVVANPYVTDGGNVRGKGPDGNGNTIDKPARVEKK